MSLDHRVKAYTQQLNQQGLLRQRVVTEPGDSNTIRFDMNDYLSLAQDKRIATAYEYGYRQFPSSSSASMLLSGYHPNHRAFEQSVAHWLAVDSCVLFSSGYAANLALTALLGAIKAKPIIDKGIHASIYDGLKQADVPYDRFVHNNVASLHKKIPADSNNTVIMTEGIFSMSGQIAPLSLIQRTNVPILVDEAHAFGVLGPHGLGATSLHQLNQEHVPLRVIPLGKAFAAQGALIAGKGEWIEALLQAGRSIVYSTAISPALTYGLLTTLDIVIAADDRRQRLSDLVHFFKQRIGLSHLNWSASDTAIQQVLLGCPHRAVDYAHQLKRLGFACSAIRAPTVNKRATGLRIVLNYCHTEAQIRSLLDKIHTINDC